MDDLLALLVDDEAASSQGDQRQQRQHHESKGSKMSRQQKRPSTTTGTSREESKMAPAIAGGGGIAFYGASVDDRIGIRMMNRIVSGTDLLDRITDRPYHAPAQLCAYSISQLQQLLQQPQSSSSSSSSPDTTVTGKTDLISVGIVFANSGTRLSASSGNAFANVTLGNLTTGPCVTVLLFGDCYRTFTTLLQPGKVVAIVNPRLLPPPPDQISRTTGNATHHPRPFSKHNGDTSIAFSVAEEAQMFLVADARDYGACPAMVQPPRSTKRDPGDWMATPPQQQQPHCKPCSHFVDKRVGPFCSRHRNHNNNNNPASNNTTTSAAAAFKVMHNVRQQSVGSARALPNKQPASYSNGTATTTTIRRMKLPRCPNVAARKTTSMATPLPHLGSSQPMRHGMPPSASSAPRTVPRGGFDASRLVNLSCLPLPPATSVHLSLNKGTVPLIQAPMPTGASRRQPLHGKSLNNAMGTNHHAVDLNRGVMKPPLNIPRTTANRNAAAAQTQSSSSDTVLVTHDILAKTKPRQSNPVSASHRKVNIDTAGFHGTIAVPKPSPILFPPQQQLRGGMMQQSGRRQPIHKDPEQILTQQQHLRKLLDCSTKPSTNNSSHAQSGFTASSRQNGSSAPTTTSTTNASALGKHALWDTTTAMDDSVRNAVIAAQSRFAIVADAEEYARSRRVVGELEQEEAQKAFKKKKEESNNNNTAIEKEWRCLTCHQSFRQQPIGCYRQNHRVELQRKIRGVQTVGEERMALSDKHADDGGMVLASGLDWSQWKK